MVLLISLEAGASEKFIKSLGNLIDERWWGRLLLNYFCFAMRFIAFIFMLRWMVLCKWGWKWYLLVLIWKVTWAFLWLGWFGRNQSDIWNDWTQLRTLQITLFVLYQQPRLEWVCTQFINRELLVNMICLVLDQRSIVVYFEKLVEPCKNILFLSLDLLNNFSASFNLF